MGKSTISMTIFNSKLQGDYWDQQTLGVTILARLVFLLGLF